MYRIINSRFLNDGSGKKYYEFSGISTDDKPDMSHISTGSLFHEVDTTKIYAYEEESGEWIEQMQLGEDASSASTASALSAPLNIPRINFGSGLNTADAEPEAVEEEAIEEEAEPEEELDEVPQGGEEE